MTPTRLTILWSCIAIAAMAAALLWALNGVNTMRVEVHRSTPLPVEADLPPLFPDEIALFGSIPYWDQDRAIARFQEHADQFDVVAMFWYYLEADGSIAKYDYAREDLAFVASAQAQGVKVLGLIANLPEDQDWDYSRVDVVIQDPAARAAHIADLVALTREKGFDGINLDYEFLRDYQTDAFSAFVQELAAALHAEGKILAVAAHAQFPGSETRGQNLRALAAADMIALMTYDEHWESSEPGPVASLPWMRSVLEYLTRTLDIPSQRIYLGIPLYGYDWPRSRGEWGTGMGFEFEDVATKQARYGFDTSFDAIAQSPYFTYSRSGISHEAWYEDARSFAAKYDLAKEFGVGGIALWRLGREDATIYDLLR